MLDQYVGRIALLHLSSQFLDENHGLLQMSGGGSGYVYAKILEHEGIGLWIEHPRWEIRVGAPEGTPEHHKANILIPWSALISIAVFPDLTFAADEGTADEYPRIGFRP